MNKEEILKEFLVEFSDWLTCEEREIVVDWLEDALDEYEPVKKELDEIKVRKLIAKIGAEERLYQSYGLDSVTIAFEIIQNQDKLFKEER